MPPLPLPLPLLLPPSHSRTSTAETHKALEYEKADSEIEPSKAEDGRSGRRDDGQSFERSCALPATQSSATAMAATSFPRAGSAPDLAMPERISQATRGQSLPIHSTCADEQPMRLRGAGSTSVTAVHKRCDSSSISDNDTEQQQAVTTQTSVDGQSSVPTTPKLVAAPVHSQPQTRRGSQFDVSKPHHSLPTYIDETGKEQQKHRHDDDPMTVAAAPIIQPPAASANKQSICVLQPPSQLIAHENLSRFLHETDVGCSMMLSRLRSGGIFLKHGARGSPHYRLVRCSFDLSQVEWMELRGDKVHGSVPTASIVSIEYGHSTRIFRERAPKTSQPTHCLSLCTPSRSLDLECCSEQERQLWSLTFAFLLEHQRMQDAGGTTSAEEWSASEPRGRHERSTSIVSALDLLCDQSTELGEAVDWSPAVQAWATDTKTEPPLLPILPPAVLFDPQLNPCIAALAADKAAEKDGQAAAAVAAAIVPPNPSSALADPLLHSKLLTQTLPSRVPSQVEHSLDLVLKHNAVASHWKEDHLGPVGATPKWVQAEPAAAQRHGSLATPTVPALTSAPDESAPDNPAMSASVSNEKEPMIPAAPAAANSHLGAATSDAAIGLPSGPDLPAHLSAADLAALQLQAELSRLVQLNQQQHSHTPSDAAALARMQSQPGVACQTPFLIDPVQFTQQDIFDLPTFAHLAAETAAEYGRPPLVAFPPHMMAAVADDNRGGVGTAAAPTAGVGLGARGATAACASTTSAEHSSQSEFDQLVWRLHAEKEADALMENDPRLQRMQRQLRSYRREHEALSHSLTAKLAKLEAHVKDMTRRNHNLRALRDQLASQTAAEMAADRDADVLAASACCHHILGVGDLAANSTAAPITAAPSTARRPDIATACSRLR